jgi:diaminopimelate decarboxylase
MLSDRDLRRFVDQGVHLNLDTRSALRRYAAIPGHLPTVGLRLDPQVRVGWGEDQQTRNARTSYGGSKFGFPLDQVEEMVEYARGLGLVVDTLHMHVGWGVQAGALPQLVDLWRRFAMLGAQIPSVSTLNVGGGLGVPHRPEDEPLSVAAWAGALADSLSAFLQTPGKSLACEPGTFLVAPAGALIVEVNTVEDRPSGRWVGVDAGHNINVYAAHYGIPLVILPLLPPREGPAMRVHLAGNINEANDVFARDLLLPPVLEGDLLVLYPCGAYGASMASDHCMRGGVVQRLL